MSTVYTNDQARKHIAANVARLLQVRGWTQRQLAEASGETDMTISRIIRGAQIPSAAILARIAEALDVSMDRLVDEPPKGNVTVSA